MNGGVKDVKSDGSFGDETEKGVVFIDVPFMITMLLDFSALKIRPAHFRGIVQRESKVFAPHTVEDIMFRLSMRLSWVATRYYLDGIVVWWLPKSIIDRVQLAQMPRWCLCQLLGASW